MAPSDIPEHILEGWTVLIVDDEHDSLELARYLLEFYGAKVFTAVDGTEGLQKTLTIMPRFIISDISMPVMDGWEFVQKVKTNPKLASIPVIALTAHAMTGDRERALGMGFHNYLTKPLTAETFMSDLIRLLAEIPEFAEALQR
ncbi:MAG: response regulator [Anaerolinea sp.]|nr:response regulator [Anaerolinea sp.]MCC6975948.1 response regulator [Anaerolineae bacterium]